MALRVSRGVFSPFRCRLLATQTAAHRADPPESGVHLPKQEPKLTQLPNGVVVASLETYAPVSRIAFVVNAGPRFESGDNLGITHCLRTFAGLSTTNSTAFGILRNIQQIGSNLTCTASREYITYQVDCIRDHVEVPLNFLKDIITCPAFKPWEVAETQPQLSLDLALLENQPFVKAFELIHQAAFRRTLGNSLYSPKFMVGNYTSDMLSSYMRNFYTSGRIAVVGLGVDHELLLRHASKLTPFSSSDVNSEKATYSGGEIRLNTGSPIVTAVLVTEGPSLSTKDLLPANTLQMIMGVGPHMKYSCNSVSRLSKAAANASSQPFAISCVNASYTDAGIFGFCVTSPQEEIGKLVRAAFKEFGKITKLGVTEQQVETAKNQLKCYVNLHLENPSNLLTDLAEQALGHRQLVSTQQLLQNIDAVSTADVNAVAKKIINAKPSMAAVGNLMNTPYMDELYK